MRIRKVLGDATQLFPPLCPTLQRKGDPDNLPVLCTVIELIRGLAINMLK